MSKEHSWISRPLASFFESVGVLVGDEVTTTLNGLVGWDAVSACDNDGYWVETKLLSGDDRVVVLASDELVRILGAKLLMLPEPPEEVTDEIELAFDEIINVAIGAWNREVSDEGRRWNNGVDARSQRRVTIDREVAGEPDGSLRAVGFTLKSEDGEYALALVGEGTWIAESAVVHVPELPAAADDSGDEALDSAPAPPSPPPAEAADSNVTPFRPVTSNHDRPRTGSRPRPSTGVRSRPATGAAAAVIPAFEPIDERDPAISGDVAVVDVSGLFLKWFYEQLRNPDFVFSHCPESFLDKGEYRAVLLVHPRALRGTSLDFEKTIIMRRS